MGKFGKPVLGVLDPAVARYDQTTGVATLVNPGQTLVRFHLGDLVCSAAIAAVPAKNPSKIAIEPRSVELGIGTTAPTASVATFVAPGGYGAAAVDFRADNAGSYSAGGGGT